MRELRYELALKNHNFSSEEQDLLIESYEAAMLRTDGIRNKPAAARGTRTDAGAGRDARCTGGDRNETTRPVQSEADVDALAQAFAALPDNPAKARSSRSSRCCSPATISRG
ncbi:MAG: hypothetical protein WDN30_15435 [Pararobbsia sp.]